MQQYLDAVAEVLNAGTRRANRTGIDTISTFNINYEIDLRNGFPLLTTKRIEWKNILIETLWFLTGDPDVSFLHKHGCKFWDPWVDADGCVPSAYGNLWRSFPVPGGKNDQIAWVIRNLLDEPLSRRHVVSAWAPSNAQTSTLPPCHCLFVLNVQIAPDGTQTLNLHLTQRSCDMALGVPYNIAGYGLLLMLLSRFARLTPAIFAHSLVDAHIYTSKPDGSLAEYDHVPGLVAQLSRQPRPLPTVKLDPRIQRLEDLKELSDASTEEILRLFPLTDYQPHPPIRFRVAV